MAVVARALSAYLLGEPEIGCGSRIKQMSSNTTDITIAHGNGWANFTAWFSRAFSAYVARRARTEQIEALEALSDAELAKLGVQRDHIVRYVFRDRCWA